jgi:integrase
MAADARGWALQRDRRTGAYFVRFRHAGRRYNRATGETVRGEAQKAAARIVAEVTSGRRSKVAGKAPPLAALVGDWLDAHSPGRAKETIDGYELHMEAHIVPYFGRLEQMTSLGCSSYLKHRIERVGANTVRKELCTLRLFLTWCHESGVLPEPVAVPRLSKRAIGEPVKKGAKRRVQLTREQVEMLIAAVPERARGGFPARAFVVVKAETGLRRATMWKLEAPRHYHVGARHLTITKDIDKARDGRPLPITDRVRTALDAVCPSEGLIFGQHGIRGLLERASMNIGLPEHLAGRVSYHDLRHFFITELAESGASLAGIQYLAGHKHASTTSRYINPGLAAAEDALKARIGTPGGTPRPKRDTKKKSTKRGKP